MHRVLDAALQGQLTEARHLLADLRDALTRFAASEEDQAALAVSIRQLDELLLKDDLALLEDIERQLAVYRDDLARGFELRMTAVEKVLVDMEARGHAFFEDTLRIGRVMDLLNRARIQKEFEDRVVADAPRHIDRRVTD